MASEGGFSTAGVPNGSGSVTRAAEALKLQQAGLNARSLSALVVAAQGLAVEVKSQKPPSFTAQEQQAFSEKLDAKISQGPYDKNNSTTSYNLKLFFLDPSVYSPIYYGNLKNIIVCRHLTAAYLKPNSNGKCVPPGSPEEIQQRAGVWTEGWCKLVRRQPLRRHLLHNQNLGLWLVQQAKKLNCNPEPAQNPEGIRHSQLFVLRSVNHAMGLTLRRKVKKGIAYYVLTFYDPNITTNHKRLVVKTPEDFANLSLKDLIFEGFYDCPSNYPGQAQHTLITEIPSPQEEQGIFSQEKCHAAIATLPPAHIQHLHKSKPIDWSTVHPSLINEILAFKTVDLSLYRYLVGCKTEKQGQALWDESRTADRLKAIKWFAFDDIHMEQWLKLETDQLLNTNKPDFDSFKKAWGQAMQKLPECLKIKAWDILQEQLGSQPTLSSFAGPDEFKQFVQNTCTMLPTLRALTPMGGFLKFWYAEKILLLKKIENCLVQILSELITNPSQNEDLAVDKAKGCGSALLECQALIREVLQQDPTLAKQLPKLSRAVFEDAGWSAIGVSPSIWHKVRSVLYCGAHTPGKQGRAAAARF